MMTEAQVRELPILLTVPLAGRVLGIGRTVAYRLVRTGQWPTPVVRVGQQYRIPRAPLLALVGLSTDSDEGASDDEVSTTLSVAG